ncbi:hypothetical protein ACU6U9_14040 [Pseudomonas sp. HK3]
MLNINKVFIALLISWLVTPVMSMASEDDLLVISIYPKNGVYDKNTLIDLVGKTEKLWTIKNKSGSSAFKTIDSLATENIIVAQQDSVRFRRLIENRELTDSGLKTLKNLVNTHPLLHDRLADKNGEQLHIWMRAKDPLTNESKKELLLSALAIFGQSEECKTNSDGMLLNVSYEEWKLTSSKPKPMNERYKSLKASTNMMKEHSILAYSASDLISYLKHSMSDGEAVNDNSSAEIEQLYMIAESVRSRHLHDLANPDFSRLKLVRMSETGSEKTKIQDFSSDLIRQWQANDSNYVSLDCRQST